MSDMKLIMENWRKFQENETEEQINEAPPEYFGADGTDPMASLALSAQGRFRDGDIEGGLQDLEAFKTGSEMQGELASLPAPIGGTATIAKYANKFGGTKFVRLLRNLFGKGKPTGAPIKNRSGISVNKPTKNIDQRQPTYGDQGPSPLTRKIKKGQGKEPPVDTQGSTASMTRPPDSNARLRRRPEPIDDRPTKVSSDLPAGLQRRLTKKQGSKIKDRKTDPKGSK